MRNSRVSALKKSRSLLQSRRRRRSIDYGKTWDRVRQEISLTGAICANCKTKKPPFHRHHIIPKALGGRDTIFNTTILCVSCHSARHGIHKW